MEKLPSELWIYIIHYLQDRPTTLCRLSLVSRQLRSIAQPALFHRINAGQSQMSKRRKLRMLQCAQPENRHVFTYTKHFTVCSPFKDSGSTLSPNQLKFPRYGVEKLILYMTNLTHLCIRTVDIPIDLWDQLTAAPFNLEELLLRYYEYPYEVSDPAITKFITNQTRLKRLGIYPSVEDMFFLDFPPETLTQLEFLSAGLAPRFYERETMTGLYIDWNWASKQPPFEYEAEELKDRVAHVRSAVMDLGLLNHWPQLRQPFERLEFLWMIIPKGKEDCYISQCHLLLPKLNFLILESSHSGWWTFNDQLNTVHRSFSEKPTLERVGFFDLIMKVWTRGGAPNGEVWTEGMDDRVDFFAKCRRFTGCFRFEGDEIN